MTEHSCTSRQFLFGQRLIGVLLLLAASTACAAPAKVKAAPPAKRAAQVVQAEAAPAAPRARPFIPQFVRIEVPPEWLHEDTCARPEWPKSSLRNEETGVVTIFMVVAPNGDLVHSGIKRSSGFTKLDEAALEAFKTCRFRPGTIDGVPEQMTAHMQYVWTLE